MPCLSQHNSQVPGPLSLFTVFSKTMISDQETPPSPLSVAMTRPAAVTAPRKKPRKVEFQEVGPLEHLPQLQDALEEVEDDVVEVVEEPKRKRRPTKRAEEPSKREEAPRSPTKVPRVRPRALPRPPASSRAQSMAAAATAEEGPRGF